MRRIFKIIPVFIVVIVFAGGTLMTALFRPSATQQRSKPSPSQETETQPTKLMELKSPAFGDQQSIPLKYTCDGQNISPPLEIKAVPENTKTLALIVHDPDAPAKDWVHWTLWNIAPDTTEILEGSVPQGAVEGMTDFGRPGYGGPCPPSGEHRYFFELYALDTSLTLDESGTRDDIDQAMEGHILAQTQLVGLYRRK